MAKNPTSIRLTDEEEAALKRIAAHHMVKPTTVIRWALRRQIASFLLGACPLKETHTECAEATADPSP